MNNTFLPRITITKQVLEDLKHGRLKVPPGQWFYSKRDNKPVKYVGTFYKNYNGVVAPMVKFSERRPGQTITQWNLSFKLARDISLLEEARYKKQLRRQGSINTRTDFTRRPIEQLNEEGGVVTNVVNPVTSATKQRDEESLSLFSKIKKFFSKLGSHSTS